MQIELKLFSWMISKSLFHPEPCMHAQSCLTLWPHDYSPPVSSVHGIFQARILEWVTISYSRGSFRHSDQTGVACISSTGKWILSCCVTWEASTVSHLHLKSKDTSSRHSHFKSLFRNKNATEREPGLLVPAFLSPPAPPCWPCSAIPRRDEKSLSGFLLQAAIAYIKYYL